MARRKRDAFEVELTDAERQTLAERLSDEIQGALDARSAIVGDNQLLDKWHEVYEGGDSRITKNTPWPGAANLTSWIGTEKVDAFRSRVVKTLFTEPIWLISGWGANADQLALLEQFHQWTAEEERLQTRLSKVVHNALIEGTGVLEVSERPALRRQRQRIRALVQANSEGLPITDAKGNKTVQVGEDGMPMEAPEGTPDNLTTIVAVDQVYRVRSGPQYRVLSLKDFVMLPGHVQEREDVWGYAKRFWKRYPELLQLQTMGVYHGVEELDETDDRQQSPEMSREEISVAPQKGVTAEKELFELTFLDDLDADGIQEWYVATISLTHRKILRLQRDDLGQARYLLFIPFPRTRFVYGYSLIGHKLDTIIQEHTAWRNMIADRMALIITAPIKRRVGSLWDPRSVPFGPGAVMDVQDMKEVEPLVIQDLPSSVVHREGSVLAAAERVAGMSDQTSGVTPQEDRTLGEVNLVNSQSMIRVEEVVKHLQEAMEDLFAIRHEIWKRTLRENPKNIPSDLMVALEDRAVQFADKTQITAEDLEGVFRGKPRGSVETSEYAVLRQDFIGLMTALTQFSQAVPTFGVLFQDPELGKALMSQAVRIFRWENRQAFEDALAKATQKAQAMAQQAQAQGQPPPGTEGQQNSRQSAGGPNGLTRRQGIGGPAERTAPAARPRRPKPTGP